MRNKKILVIGGANIEYILKSKTDIVQGSKNFVEIEELLGGSGVNYTMRLMSYGEVVYPILFAGDDSTGHQVLDALLPYAQPDNRYFFDEKTFFVPSVQTPRSTIIVEGIHRTILSQDANQKNLFHGFLAHRLQDVPSVGALIIGHIHNDRKEINPHATDLSTLYALDHFQKTETLIYANFGASQLEYGFDFWKSHLSKIDILQLNIHELRDFLTPNTQVSLPALVEMIQALDITMIITLDQFGAMGIMKGVKDTIFMARPIKETTHFVDSTGAGDAFCAGMLSKLKGKKRFAQEDFMEAMERGRSWATYACRSYGGANHCPSPYEIVAYHQERTKNNKVIRYNNGAMQDVIALIDSLL